MKVYYYDRTGATNQEPDEIIALQFSTEQEAIEFAEAATQAWKDAGTPFKLELLA